MEQRYATLHGQRRRVILRIATLAFVLAGVGASGAGRPAGAHAATDTLVVDASGNNGAPTYRANGFLCPFTGDGAQPPDSLVSPLKIREIRCNGDGYGSAYDNRETGMNLAHHILELQSNWDDPHGFPNVTSWPCDNNDCGAWRTTCTTVANQYKNSGPSIEYDIWNEPDSSFYWPRSEGQWFQAYDACYDAIRAVNPNAVIIGPSTTGGPDTFFGDFVAHVKSNGRIPTYVDFHILGNGHDPVADVNTARGLLSGVNYAGIEVPEFDYQNFSVNNEAASGLAWDLARFERAGVTSAGHACGNCFGGTLDDALVNGNTTGGWWVYHRYADITGHLLPVTAGTSLDGVAGADATTHQVRVLVGQGYNATTGSMVVRLTNLNNASYVLNGAQTYVTVEDIPKSDNVSAPTIIQSGYVSVSNNEADVTINGSNASDAYNIILSPTSGGSSYQASSGFSSTQNQNQWDYYYSTNNEGGISAMTWDSGNSRWTAGLTSDPSNPDYYCLIGSNWQHPGLTCDSVRIWAAQKAGTVTIGANGPISVVPGCNGNTSGVQVRVYLGGTGNVWPSGSGWQHIANGSSVSFPSGVSVNVGPGYDIEFVVQHVGSSNACDSTTWDPTVTYN